MRFAIAAAALFATTVSASAPVSRPGVWHERDVNGECHYVHDYPDSGRTIVVILKNGYTPYGFLGFGVKNDNWSVKQGDVITEPVTVSSGTFSMTGDVLTLNHRLLIIIPIEMVRRFVASEPKLVVVSRGRQTLTTLGFSGFKAGWKGFVSCLAKVDAARANQLQRERQANPDVPVDPFAPPPVKPDI